MLKSMKKRAQKSMGRLWNRILTPDELSQVGGGHGPHCGVGEPKPVGSGSPGK